MMEMISDDDPEGARRWLWVVMMHRAGRPLSEAQRAELAELWMPAALRLQKKLARGDLILEGLVEGSFDIERPHPLWSRIALLDPLLNTAEAKGRCVTDVRIIGSGRPVRSAGPPACRREVTSDKVTGWMRTHVQTAVDSNRPKPVRDAVISAAMAETKCTRDAARKAYSNLEIELKYKRGERTEFK
jgi:hypothetical protein